jgi:hypothetical protein
MATQQHNSVGVDVFDRFSDLSRAYVALETFAGFASEVEFSHVASLLLVLNRE